MTVLRDLRDRPLGTHLRLTAGLLPSTAILLALWFAVPVAAEVSPPLLVANLDQRSGAPPLERGALIVPLLGRQAIVVEERLWISDGTETGTVALCPEAEEPGCELPRIERVLATGDTGLFFGGAERLWHTDGTVSGTVPLTDSPLRYEIAFQPEEALFDPARGLLFLRLHHPLRGSEPWVTDGTRAGTRALGDLAPGGWSSEPEYGGQIGDLVVFSAADRQGGREPWVTDGTPDGTRRLREIVPGPGASFPVDFRSLGDRVVFVASTPSRGSELWATDGTPEGTGPLPEVVPGEGEALLILASDPLPGGVLFFAQHQQEGSLWLTDGTPAGTRKLRPLDLRVTVPPTVAGDLAFFEAADSHGREPWISDGTAAGTRRLADLCPGPCSSRPGSFERFGRHVFFTADDGLRGSEPWISDGTLAGTRSLGDLRPGSLPSLTRWVAGNDTRLFLQTDLDPDRVGPDKVQLLASEAPFTGLVPLFEPDASPLTRVVTGSLSADELVAVATGAEHGVALWRSDGSSEGTEAVHTLIPSLENGSAPSNLVRLGDRVYFLTHTREASGTRSTLWRTRGTPGSAKVVHRGFDPEELPITESLGGLTALADRLVFLRRHEDATVDLWASGGSSDSTVPVARDVGAQLAQGPLPTVERLAFLGSTGSEPGLWVTDGTADGTRRLRELRIQEPRSVGTFQGRLFFGAALPAGPEDFELWVSDGTVEGTLPLTQLNPDGPSRPRELTPVGDRLFFVANTTDGPRLHQTDGTPDGTRRVDLPGAALTDPSSLTAVDHRLVFTSLQAVIGLSFCRAVWATDGTEEGTRKLMEVTVNELVPELERVVAGSEMFFLAGELGGRQIWRTDGTPAGTRPWRFVPPDQIPGQPLEVAGRLLIPTLALSGPELWWSGDLQGAEQVGDFREVGEPIRLGSTVLFRGTRPVSRVGSELWAFETDDFETPLPPPPDKPVGRPEAPESLEVFVTEGAAAWVTWRDRSTNETSFVLEVKTPDDPGFRPLVEVPADTESVRVQLVGETPFTVRVRAENGHGVSDWSEEASGALFFGLEACIPSDERLCLLGGRFRVEVRWHDPFNEDSPFPSGIGHARSFDFSDDAGAFWFFDPDNVELVVKVLDAQSVNGFYWTFYGALTNVEYWITVADLVERTSRTYHNPPGHLCGLGDTRSFPRFAPPPSRAALSGPRDESVEPGEPATALSLTGDRFRVEVSWRDPRSGDTGHGFALPGTDDSGFFWFFDPENVELVIKVLDARRVNGHFWVFYGGLSDVEYEITVTDTVENVARTYRNPAFEICGQADTSAF